MVRRHAQKRKEASLGLSLRPGHRSQTRLRLADLISGTRTRTIQFLVGGQAELNTELSTDRSAEVQFDRTFYVSRASIAPNSSSEGLSNGQIAIQDLQRSGTNQ